MAEKLNANAARAKRGSMLIHATFRFMGRPDLQKMDVS